MSNIQEDIFNLSFDDLYAYRFQYQDSTTDENIIIQKLKDLLYQTNPNLYNNIDEYLFQFYTSFGYPITLDDIIKQTDLSDLPISQDDDSDDSHDSMPDLIPSNDVYNHVEFYYNHQYPFVTNPDTPHSINATIEIFLNLLQSSHMNHMTDVVVTTNEDSLQSLGLKVVTESNIQDIGKCSICMTNFEIDDKILDIECKHNFHKECLEEYLKKYNHICPICRQDIGKTYTDTGNTS